MTDTLSTETFMPTDQDMHRLKRLVYSVKCRQLDPAGVSRIGFLALRVLERMYSGLHHCDDVLRRTTEETWTNPLWVELTVDCSDWATFDFADLTRLVVIAHDMCIRISIQPTSRHRMRVMLHPRAGREGDMCRRHPTIEEAIKTMRLGYADDFLAGTAGEAVRS
jgi:hypothetical protein